MRYSDFPVLRCDVVGSYAWEVHAKRHPALIQQVRDTHPYGPEEHRALDNLAAEISGDVLPLTDSERDKTLWDDWYSEYLGTSWFGMPFLFVEALFYRKLLAATGYFRPGPWLRHDLFAGVKSAELSAPSVDEDLRLLSSPEVSLSELLLASLWGNKADLAHSLDAASDRGDSPSESVEALVADDIAVIAELLSSGLERVCFVADNAGREILADLVLVERLLDNRSAERLVLHVKPQPSFVSDATPADVAQCVQRLAAAGGPAESVASNLKRFALEGRFVIETHDFFCSPFDYRHLPDDLTAAFDDTSLTIFKGDLNYRRLVGDRAWPAMTPFADAVEYFPGPVAALRTLKSEVVVGLSRATVDALEQAGPPWRTTGTHALIQARL